MDWTERYWAKVKKSNGCWLWTGATSRGYGHFCSSPYSTKMAHRISYMELVGSIPEGKQLHHLCEIRNCVNPAHLEPVTARENLLLSSKTAAAKLSSQTHCKRGHEFTAENTYVWGNMRHCKECVRTRSREWYRKKNPGIKLRRGGQ